MSQRRELFVLASSAIVAKALTAALAHEYDVTAVVHEDLLKASLTQDSVTQLRENKETVILLAGFEEEAVGQFLWQNIRLIYELLNPVLVCGYESKVAFAEKHYEFTSGADRYHQYLEMPWRQSGLVTLLNMLDEPLYDDWQRERLYESYGETNLRNRLPAIMHGLQGKKVEKLLPLAEHVLFLCRNLDDEEILVKMQRMVQELQSGKTDNVKLLKREIKSKLKGGEENGEKDFTY